MTSHCFLIIGASKGIGKALTLNLASSFPDVPIVCVSRTISSKESEFTSQNANIHCLDADVGTEQGVQSILDFLQWKVKYLIYSAGILGPSFDEMGSPKDFERVMSVNTKGAFFLTRGLQSKFTNDARVLYLTSSVGEAYKVPYPFYAISKKALNMVYEVMKKELKGILVAAVHPGLVKTDMYHVQAGKLPGFKERSTIDPRIAAKFLKFILSEKVNSKEYSDEIWSIYNLHHQPRWLEEGDEAPGQA